MVPARCGGMRLTTSYFTLSPKSVATSRPLASTLTTLLEALALILGQPLDLLPLNLPPRRDDEPVVLQIPLADPDAPGLGLDRRRRLVAHAHAVPAEPAVVEREAVDRPYPAQHEVAERTGDERAVRLQ